MKPSIKSFIYLDEYKLYSLSSQLFKGFTESVLSVDSSKYSEGEEQKGKYASGRMMSDILTKEHSATEKKFLHDYAFNLLEEELVKQELLYPIAEGDTKETIQDKKIIKISGRAVFNDYATLQETVCNFNSIGESFAYFMPNEGQEEINGLINNAINSTKDRNQKVKIKNVQKVAEKQRKDYLIAIGMQLPDGQIQHMTNLIKYGYHGELEFRVIPENVQFQISAILNRDYLRDKESHFVSKYSRQSECEFTVIGIVTQAGKNKLNYNENSASNGVKEACINLSDKLTILENVFLGRLENECIIDPIAIYREI